MHRRLAAAATLSVTLLLGACTDDTPKPPAPPSSVPAMPSARPTPSVTSSGTSSPADRKHLDLLHIQELYKSEFADETKVLMAGGSKTLPPAIERRTSGLYQQVVLDSFRKQRKKGQRLITGGKIVGVAMGKWSPDKVKFRGCEDYSGVRSVDKNGHEINNGPGARVVQTYEVLKRHGEWRIDSASGKAVRDFHATPCNGTWYS